MDKKFFLDAGWRQILLHTGIAFTLVIFLNGILLASDCILLKDYWMLLILAITFLTLAIFRKGDRNSAILDVSILTVGGQAISLMIAFPFREYQNLLLIIATILIMAILRIVFLIRPKIIKI